jgi:hypothetical protein
MKMAGPESSPPTRRGEEGPGVRTFLFFHKFEMKKNKKPQIAPKLSPECLEKVRARAAALAEPHGLQVRDVTFGPTDLGLTLSVVVASADGKALSVTDCETVARPLGKELDDLLDERTPPYMFEVASVGVDPEPQSEMDEDLLEEVPEDES